MKSWHSPLVALGMVVALTGCSTPVPPLGRDKWNPEGQPPFTFLVIGDTCPGRRAHTNDEASVSIDCLINILWMNRQDPDLVISLGDVIRGNNGTRTDLTERQWDTFDKAAALIEAPFFLTPGNHDAANPAERAIRIRRYGPMHYSFDHKGCHFTVISPEPVPSDKGYIGTEQTEWLRRDLAGATNAYHRFLFLHPPLWKAGPPSPVSSNRQEWIDTIHPMLTEFRVDTVFAGHEHLYEFEERDGVRFVTSGGGGQNLITTRPLGGFHHFTKVVVPAEGDPIITVVEGSAEYPQDVVKAGLRQKIGEIRQALVPPIVIEGEDAPYRMDFTIRNPLEEDMVFRMAWGGTEAGAPTVQPSRVSYLLAPGATQEVQFVGNLQTPGGTMPSYQWTLTAGNQLVMENKGVLTLARKGAYLARPDAPPSGAALLRTDSTGQIVFGAAARTGTEDCSAVAWVAKDATGITVTVEICDDTLRTGEKLPWENDGVDVFFDIRPASRRGTSAYEKGVVHMIAVPDLTHAAAGSLTFYPSDTTDRIPGATLRTELTPGRGYRLILFLPLDGIAAAHGPVGDTFNFSYAVNDADAGPRETQMEWSGARLNHSDASAFGRMKAQE